MNKLLSPSPLWQTAGLALIRMTVGYFMIYHGEEVFDKNKMNEYLQWEMFKGYSFAGTMVYAGKIAELAGGIFLFIGLFTRIGALILVFTMGYIAFFVGKGEVWYMDQHPFLFVLLALVFFFTGSGKLSVDYYLFNKKTR